MQTSADKVYIIYPTSEDDEYVYFTDKNQVQQKVEKGILRKSVYDARLRRYEQIEANSYIIFPYENSNGRPQLIDIEAMKSHFPATLEYMSLLTSKGKHFQIIMLEHVSEKAWNGCKHINLVATFDGINNALIPLRICGSTNEVVDKE